MRSFAYWKKKDFCDISIWARDLIYEYIDLEKSDAAD